MMLAVLPPPDSYAAIGWLCVAAAAIAYGVNQIWELINRFRGEPPHPPNNILEADQTALAARVDALEQWKESLTEKMDADKLEILAAGTEREKKLSSEIASVGKRVDGLQGALSQIPNEFMALLANAKNLLGGGK